MNEKLLLLVFSPWAGLGRDQSSVRQLNYTVVLKKFRQLNLVKHFVHLVFYSQKKFGFKTE